MQSGVQKLLAIMPFLFGVGFIAPLTAEILQASGMAGPLGMSRVGFGLAFGGAWGLYATIRGRWI
jgi:hypothetical protein